MQNLRLLRKEKHMTTAELAAYLEISAATVGHYELGKREPDILTLIKLADYFDCTVDFLIGRSEVRKPPFKERDMKMLENLNRLTPHDYNLAYDLILTLAKK